MSDRPVYDENELIDAGRFCIGTSELDPFDSNGLYRWKLLGQVLGGDADVTRDGKVLASEDVVALLPREQWVAGMAELASETALSLIMSGDISRDDCRYLRSLDLELDGARDAGDLDVIVELSIALMETIEVTPLRDSGNSQSASPPAI